MFCHTASAATDAPYVQKRNAKKEASEKKYYAQKTYISGDW